MCKLRKELRPLSSSQADYSLSVMTLHKSFIVQHTYVCTICTNAVFTAVNQCTECQLQRDCRISHQVYRIACTLHLVGTNTPIMFTGIMPHTSINFLTLLWTVKQAVTESNCYNNIFLRTILIMLQKPQPAHHHHEAHTSVPCKYKQSGVNKKSQFHYPHYLCTTLRLKMWKYNPNAILWSLETVADEETRAQSSTRECDMMTL